MNENNNNNQSNLQFTFPYFQFFANPKTFQGLIKEQFIFISTDRNMENILDFCKIADIICPILSCKDCQVDKINLDPYQNANAFDDYAYNLLRCLRIQGLPSTVCILQDLNLIQPQKQHQVKKLFFRYFESEFGEISNISLENENSFIQLLRILQGQTLQKMDWRDQRGYFLADKVSYQQQTQTVEITGYLKGSCLNANQLINIVGYDDYQIDKIEILPNPFKNRIKNKKIKIDNNNILQKQGNIEQENNIINEESKVQLQSGLGNQQLTQCSDPQLCPSLNPWCKLEEHNANIDANNLLNAIEELNIGGNEEEEKKEEIQEKKQKNDIELEDEHDEEIQQEDEDLGSDVSYDDKDDLLNQNAHDIMEEKKKHKFELEQRKEDDLEFEDEVEYTPETILKDRYGKYQYLKSFKNTDWNIYENLPNEYEKIYTFKNFPLIKKNGLIDALNQAFAYPGFYIKIYIKNFPIQILQNHPKEKPLIIVGLLKHERKMTMIHLKLKINKELENAVFESKNKDYEIQIGFRKLVVRPIFSKYYSNTSKTKYVKKVSDYNNFYIASFYYYCCYTPCPVLLFDSLNNKKQAIFGMSGELYKNDSLQVILKRIQITGYPYKINKRKAVIRYMFFNPLDIKYFQPAELKTKLGLRGHIIESLGTHGMMKCSFSGQIKQHDTIIIELYKRVFPKNVKIN